METLHAIQCRSGWRSVFWTTIKECKSDPCKTYTVLPHAQSRSIYNTATKTPANLICDDKLIQGWYAFEYAASIPTSCPQPFSCGTLLPVWINGTNPSVKDGAVTRQGCVNSGSPASCCSSVLDIGVKNCSTFFIYYLNPTPGCPLAYCSDLTRYQSTAGATLTTAGTTTPTSVTKPPTVGLHWITFGH